MEKWKIVIIAMMLIFLLSLTACYSSLRQDKMAQMYVELGMGYLKSGQRPRAQYEFMQAMRYAPNSVSVNTAMAYYNEQVGDNTRANAYYLKALKLAPGAGGPLNNYAVYLCRRGLFHLAKNYFARAMLDEQYNNRAGLYENAGLCALRYHDLKTAKNYFKQAVAYDPSRKKIITHWKKHKQQIN